MSDKNRKFLEQNDLSLLHGYFDENPLYAGAEEVSVPFIDNPGREDIWTEVIEAAVSRDSGTIKRMLAKIKQSNISTEGKKFWESVLTIAMEAPLEELERLIAENPGRQINSKKQYLSVGTKKLLQLAAEKERVERKMKRQKEEERLRNLQEEAAKRRQEKDLAELNLERHRKSQGGN